MKYLAWIRWLFHGLFSAQDAWMVEQTQAPPEQLYRPDSSIIAWRRLCEKAAAARAAAAPPETSAPPATSAPPTSSDWSS